MVQSEDTVIPAKTTLTARFETAYKNKSEHRNARVSLYRPPVLNYYPENTRFQVTMRHLESWNVCVIVHDGKQALLYGAGG